MPALNNSPTSYHYWLVASWLVASWLVITLVAAAFFMSEKVVEFDPDGLLTNQSAQEIVDALQIESVTMQGHLKSSNYGQGFACTEKTGVVTAVLTNLQKGFNSALVLNQARGCYCAKS